MINTSAGSPRSSRTGIAFVVVPIEGPYATTTLLPVCFSNSGTSALKAAVRPPEIMTCTSAASAAPVNSSKAASATNKLRNLVVDGIILIPPREHGFLCGRLILYECTRQCGKGISGATREGRRLLHLSPQGRSEGRCPPTESREARMF